MKATVVLSVSDCHPGPVSGSVVVDKIPNQVPNDILKNTPPSPYQGEGLGVRLICHPEPKVKIINVCDREWDSSDTACPFRMTK